jgi:CRP-like cAMP-binding protein
MCKNLPFLEDRSATIKARQSVSIPLLNRKALREITHEYHAFGLESEELVKKAKLTLKNIGRREDYSPFPYFDESGS